MKTRSLEILRDVFGYTEFRPGQAAVIEHLNAGGDALLLMPTGGGKSLCYQIPALVRPGTGLVVSPLIALMEDQVEALAANGVRAAFLNSSLAPSAQREVERALRAGELDLLYLAPERLLMPPTLQMLAEVPLAMIAVDEAHCVSQWGHDFRPEYLQLNVLVERFPEVPIIAVTATADERTRAEIPVRLGLREPRIFATGFDRPNIYYRIVHDANARESLLRFMKDEYPEAAGIVYCLSRARVESTAKWLSGRGIRALPYHAGLTAETRREHQRRFLHEDGIVIVATIAFGMGIDKPDVRFVAHLDLPKSVEAYYQETGRAGRDGLASTAWMAYGLQSVTMLARLAQNSDADEAHKRMEQQRLDAMLGLCEITSCRRRALLQYFDDDYDHACGHCDNCCEPMELWDGTEAARKALSCVYRTGQRFGAGHVIDVLRGRTTQRVTDLGHDSLSTFGIGEDLDAKQWRSVFRQLVARGLLVTDAAGYGSLALSNAARPLLKGETVLELRKDPVGAKKKRRSAPAAVASQDQGLWDSLRNLRRDLAEERGVPPYVIFHDATLAGIVASKPANESQLGEVSGIGAAKLEHFGAQILEAVAAHET